MIRRNIIIWVIIILSLPCSGLATSKEFIESYTYNAGEADSKLTCRTVSVLEIKRLCWKKSVLTWNPGLNKRFSNPKRRDCRPNSWCR